MTFVPDFTYRTATPADQETILSLDAWAFPSEMTPKQMAGLPFPLDHSRTRLVFAGDQPAAMHSSYEFLNFPVPGNTMAVAGLSWVGVHPQFRRRGILRAMIEKHFAECAQRGEAVSTLFAAEPTIYGRFGYGLASHDARVTIPRGAALKPVPGSKDLRVQIEIRDRAVHAELINQVHLQAGANVNGTGLNRPGWAGRETAGLQEMWHNPAGQPGGKEPQRIITVWDNDQAVAYATFRRTTKWENTGPTGTVTVGEVVATSPASSHRLWSTLVDLDLTTEVKPFMLATDDPILSLLENARQLDLTLVDNAWARIINLPAALVGRQYAADLDVVLDVTDPIIVANSGRWRLRATAFNGPTGDRKPVVEKTEQPADLSLNIQELSALYLGGRSVTALAASGLVQASDPRILGQASAGFSWPNAPVSSWVY